MEFFMLFEYERVKILVIDGKSMPNTTVFSHVQEVASLFVDEVVIANNGWILFGHNNFIGFLIKIVFEQIKSNANLTF
jgi:hypothetical protein